MRGRLIGQVKITPDTSHEGGLDGEVEIVLADEDRPPDRISVTGRVIGDIEVAPQTSILPRTVDGLEVYQTEVRVWSREKKAVLVEVLSADEPLSDCPISQFKQPGDNGIRGRCLWVRGG